MPDVSVHLSNVAIPLTVVTQPGRNNKQTVIDVYLLRGDCVGTLIEHDDLGVIKAWTQGGDDVDVEPVRHMAIRAMLAEYLTGGGSDDA